MQMAGQASFGESRRSELGVTGGRVEEVHAQLTLEQSMD